MNNIINPHDLLQLRFQCLSLIASVSEKGVAATALVSNATELYNFCMKDLGLTTPAASAPTAEVINISDARPKAAETPAPKKKAVKDVVEAAPVVQEEAAVDVDGAAEPSPDTQTYTDADVHAVTVQLVNTKGKAAVVDVLKAFGAGNITQIKPEQRAAYVERCNEMMR